MPRPNSTGHGQRRTYALGALIKSSRQSKGLTRAELALETGVTVSMVCKIENGRRPITHPDTIATFAEALNIEVDHIYQLQGITPPDIINLARVASTLNASRVRWALSKIVGGQLFDVEIVAALSGLPQLPGEVLVPRKRTQKEERDWDALLAKSVQQDQSGSAE